MKDIWTKPNKLICAAVVIAIYLSLALWLKYSYVGLRPKVDGSGLHRGDLVQPKALAHDIKPTGQ